MKTKLMALAILGSFALAGCGGGGDDGLSLAEEEALQERVEAAEKAQEAARREAEEAEQREQQEAERAAAAEAERQRLEQEAEEARQAANAAAARRALAGSRTTGGTEATLAATPRYGMAAIVTVPSGTSPTTSSQTGRWRSTSLTGRTATTVDTVEVYADIEAPDPVNFKDSTYNSGNSVVNAEGDVIGEVAITGSRADTAASSFPSTSGPAKSFDYVDRGFDDQAAKDTEIDACTEGDPCPARNIPVRDTDRYPLRYAVDVGGRLGGASGTFRCDAASTDTACTVQNRGNTFFFAGPWAFIPSSGTTKVFVPDAQYMWFGWWARQTPGGDPTWAFQAKHGGATGAALTDVDDVTGTATYRGTAAGRYAVYQPVGGPSSTGSFTASASLTANFDTDSVSGSITGFSNDPDWSVTLKPGAISGGAAGNDGTDTDDPGGTTWTINGAPLDSGSWEAQFYSNLPSGQREGVVPYGIAGTFQADYGTVGRMIGAFGAHR